MRICSLSLGFSGTVGAVPTTLLPILVESLLQGLQLGLCLELQSNVTGDVDVDFPFKRSVVVGKKRS